MLFKVLPEEIFRPFNGKYRRAYGALVQKLHDGLFSVSSPRQPTKPEVIADFEDCLAAYLRAAPEEADDFLLSAPDAYAELRDSGWLIEQREGWNVYVEMETAVAALMNSLCTLDARRPTFGGTMASVLSNLESAYEDPDGRSETVLYAAKDANEFARFMRAVVGSLKGVEKEMLSRATFNEATHTFFNKFVERIVIGDYSKLTTIRNHPYGLRYRVQDMVDSISSDAGRFAKMAASMVEHGEAVSVADAENRLLSAMHMITQSLTAIEDLRARIDRTKGDIEERYTNTLRYMDLVETGRADCFAAALSVFGRTAGAVSGDDEIELPTGLVGPFTNYSEGRSALAQAPKGAVEPKRHRKAPMDPLKLAFEMARRAFADRLSLTPEKFMAYFMAKLDGRDEVTAAEIPPCDIDEFLIFSALRALPMQRIYLPHGAVLERRDGWVDNPWVECGDFVLRQSAPRRAAADPEDGHVA
jgi:hypothetical protein